MNAQKTAPKPVPAKSPQPAFSEDRKLLSPQEKTVKASRDKSAKFIELVQKRMNKALRAIDGVGNLSNRHSYTYTADQVARINAALAASCKEVADRFARVGDAPSKGFTL